MKMRIICNIRFGNNMAGQPCTADSGALKSRAPEPHLPLKPQPVYSFSGNIHRHGFRNTDAINSG